MRVLAVTNMYPTDADPCYGGFIATQMDAVKQAGADVEVEFVNGRRSDWEYAAGITRVRRLVARGSFDVVHAHYGLCGFVAAFQSLPLVVSFWGDDLLGTPDGRGGITAKSRLIRAISFLAARRADAINCESEEMRSCLPRSLDRARASVIPNGVDLDRFAPGDRAEARRRIGVSTAERLIIFPNTPTERRKRLDLAEAAVAILNSKGVSARLWIVQRIPPASMPDYYRAADCLLLTSDWEGSPNVVKEALCSDLPVVSVDAGDTKELLALVPGGAVVPREPEAIAQALAVALREGKVNGDAARKRLAAPRLARDVLAVYDAAILVRSRGRGGKAPRTHG